MNVLIDTSVWSLALRRRKRGPPALVGELEQLIRDGRVVMMGPVRQELLSGVRSGYEALRDHLRVFPDVELARDDYELAAELFNRCRDAGLQGSNTDFLLCAVARRRRLSLFTTDQDFAGFSRILGLVLHGGAVASPS